MKGQYMADGAGWKKKLWIVVLAFAALLGLGWVFVRSGPVAPVGITVSKVVKGSIPGRVSGIGEVVARQTWELGPATPGRLRAVYVDVGDVVHAGQLLAEMDPVDMAQRLKALDASVARALAQESVAVAQQADASARRELARANYKRYQGLADGNFISAGALESRYQEVNSAQAALDAAQSGVQGAHQEMQRVQAERAALLRVQENLRLLAPGDGVVVARDVQPGSAVLAGQGVVRMVDPGSIWVRVRLDQGQCAGMRVGLPAQVVLRSQPRVVWPAKVSRVELLADSVTEERQVMVSFDTMPGMPFVGEIAEVTISLPDRGPGLVVPLASLRHWDGLGGVWRMQDGKLEFVVVELLARSPNGLALVGADSAKSLASGDAVLVYSERPVVAGMRFHVVDAASFAGNVQ